MFSAIVTRTSNNITNEQEPFLSVLMIYAEPGRLDLTLGEHNNAGTHAKLNVMGCVLWKFLRVMFRENVSYQR